MRTFILICGLSTLLCSCSAGAKPSTPAVSNTPSNITLPTHAFAGSTINLGLTFGTTSTQLTEVNPHSLHVATPTKLVAIEDHVTGANCTAPVSLTSSDEVLADGENHNLTLQVPSNAPCTHTITLIVNGQRITWPTPLTVSVENATISSEATTALPQNIELNTSHSVVFTFTNTHDLPLSGLSFVKQSTGTFNVLNNTCTSTLPADSNCSITGIYTPRASGAESLSYLVTSSEGSRDTASTTTSVTSVDVSGTVSTPLPDSILLGNSYPVVFTFENSNAHHAATGVSITNPPSGFSVTSNTCSTTIAAHSSCQITGSYTPSSVGDVSLSYTLSYDQGTDVTLTTNSTAAHAVVTGEAAAAIPFLLKANHEYTGITLRFTNASDDTAAYTSFVHPDNFTVTSNACSAGIDANSSCDIVGTYTAPSASGQTSATFTLNYGASQSVSVSNTPLVMQTPRYIFTANYVGDAIKSCDITDNRIETCRDLVPRQPAAEASPNSLAINPSQTRLYITNIVNRTISHCEIGSNGYLSDCITQNDLFSTFHPSNIYLTPSGTYAYVLEDFSGDDNVFLCDVNNTNGNLSNCAVTVSGGSTVFRDPSSITYGINQQYAYITGYAEGKLARCDVAANGSLSNCAEQPLPDGVTLTGPDAITINPSNNRFFIAERASSSIEVCDQTFSSCSTISSIPTGPDTVFSMAFSPLGTHIFLAGELDASTAAQISGFTINDENTLGHQDTIGIGTDFAVGTAIY